MKTSGGVFARRVYEPVHDGAVVGAKLVLEFLPNDDVAKRAGMVGMIQVNRRIVDGKLSYRDAREKARSTPDGWGVDMNSLGFGVDFRPCNTSPVYQSQFNESADLGGAPRIATSLSDVGDTVGGNEGRGRVWTREEPQTPAGLVDSATTEKFAIESSAGDEFETSAIVLDDGWKGLRFLGSVRWGWRSGPQGKGIVLTDVLVVGAEAPTAAFLAAAERWNAQDDLKDDAGKRIEPVRIPIP